MRKSYKYASIVAALSVSGLGGAALVLHDRNVQGTISDDVYWKKIASANKNSNALVTDNETVDDLISLADRINSEESSSILSKNATSLVNKAQKNQNKTNLINPIVEKAVEDVTDSNKEEEKEDKNKTQDTSSDTKKEETVKEGWNADKTMYYVDGTPVTGLYTIEGQEYYFDEKGKLYTGFLEVKDEDDMEETLYYKDGLKCYKRTKIGDNYYYFDSENGYMVVYEWVGDRFYDEDGKEIHGLYTLGDKQYYFYNDGKLAVGFHTETYNGHKIRCYSNDDIEKDDYGVKQYGVIEVNGKTIKLDTVTGGEYDGEWKDNIYYDEDGETLSGKQTIAGRDMYFKDNGEAVFGWYVDSYNNAYYADPDTGIQAFGLVSITENADAENEENQISHIYYFDEDSGISISAGWHKGSDIGQLNGKIYFVAQKGKAPYLATGRTEIDGEAYYFDEETGMLQLNMRGEYYTDENGEIQTGEQEVDGKKVFYDDNGHLVNGWYTKDGKTYYYGTNGKAKGEVTIDGIKFEFDEETGELLSKGFIDGLYINDDGSIFYGLKEIDGNTYYFDKTKGGKYATGTVTIPKEYSVSGKTTTEYFDENGHQVLGFVTISGSTYWFDKSQGRVTNTIITTNGNKYYFAEDGRLYKNGTRKIDNNSKKITSDENGVITKIESMGIENPLLPANDSFEWHAASDYETHSGNPFSSPWCTWWAWNRFYEIYGYSPGTHGNGCTNADELIAAHPDKFQKSDTLVAGAMFSVQPFGSGASATAGHVGIIEKVEGDYVYTSEGGYVNGGGMGVGLKKYTKAEFYATYPSVTIAAPISD